MTVSQARKAALERLGYRAAGGRAKDALLLWLVEQGADPSSDSINEAWRCLFLREGIANADIQTMQAAWLKRRGFAVYVDGGHYDSAASWIAFWEAQ